MIHTLNHISIRAPAALVYDLAADIARWPELLSHYRYVHILEQGGQEPGGKTTRVARMAASRSGIPVSWTSVQLLDPERIRIRYHHIGGVTRGMDVEWRIDAFDHGSQVTIEHDLTPASGLLRVPLAPRIAGDVFISHIADQTLRGIKRHAESGAAG